MTDQQDRVIAEIAKNETETVRVALVTFKGRPGVDVRIYARYRSTGEVGPTKAGLRIAPEKLPELIAALEKARALASMSSGSREPSSP